MRTRKTAQRQKNKSGSAAAAAAAAGTAAAAAVPIGDLSGVATVAEVKQCMYS